jgi:hypothetical protein
MRTLKEDLDSIGKEFFLNYLHNLKETIELPNNVLIELVVSQEKFSLTSATTRVYSSRRIIKNKVRFRQALEILIHSDIAPSAIEIAKEELANLDLPEKRIARITWNDNGWIFPSGRSGKSKLEGSHEEKYGYGHEEWLFDTSKLIDGWHYGFLEPVRQEQDFYTGKKYDVWLFTIDSKTKLRYWVGKINTLEVISSEHAKQIKQLYREKGWLNEMDEQIIASGADNDVFSKWNGIDTFNIRYRLADLQINDPYYVLPQGHPAYDQSRYTFSKYRKEFEIEIKHGLPFVFKHDAGTTESLKGGLTKGTYNREPKTVEISFLHKVISDSLVVQLKRQHGNENVTPEHPTGKGANRIDIAVKDKDGKCIFYEIKTYNSLLTSMREAIGQLLEYAFYSSAQNAKELIIVTQKHENISEVKVYLSHLRKLLNIPLYYQWYDWEKEEQSAKY